MSLIRVLLVVVVSSETGESNLHHIYAAFLMDYNNANGHVRFFYVASFFSIGTKNTYLFR